MEEYSVHQDEGGEVPMSLKRSKSLSNNRSRSSQERPREDNANDSNSNVPNNFPF
jgi:hypothetical protein